MQSAETVFNTTPTTRGRWHSGPADTADNYIQLGQYLVPLLERFLSLRLGSLEILFEILDISFLVLFAIVEAGQRGYEVLYLLLLEDEVPRQLLEAGLKLVGGKRVHYASRQSPRSEILYSVDMSKPTFFLLRLLLHVANLVIGAERLEIVSPVDKVQTCDELLSELSVESAHACPVLGFAGHPGSTWSTASCSCVSRSPIVTADVARSIAMDPRLVGTEDAMPHGRDINCRVRIASAHGPAHCMAPDRGQLTIRCRSSGLAWEVNTLLSVAP